MVGLLKTTKGQQNYIEGCAVAMKDSGLGCGCGRESLQSTRCSRSAAGVLGMFDGRLRGARRRRSGMMLPGERKKFSINHELCRRRSTEVPGTPLAARATRFWASTVPAVRITLVGTHCVTISTASRVSRSESQRATACHLLLASAQWSVAGLPSGCSLSGATVEADRRSARG